MPLQSRQNQAPQNLVLCPLPYTNTPWGMLSHNTGFTGWSITSAPTLVEHEGFVATFLGTQTFSLKELAALPILAPIYLNEIQFFQELRNAINLSIATEVSAGVFSINGDLLVQEFNNGVYGTWRWDITGPFGFFVGTKEELFEKILLNLEDMGIDIEQWDISKQEALRLVEQEIQDCLACGVAKNNHAEDGENVYIMNLVVAEVAMTVGLVGRWRWLANWKQPEQQEEAEETREQKAADRAMVAENASNTKLEISDETEKEPMKTPTLSETDC
jgi:hypothetical protein